MSQFDDGLERLKRAVLQLDPGVDCHLLAEEFIARKLPVVQRVAKHAASTESDDAKRWEVTQGLVRAAALRYLTDVLKPMVEGVGVLQQALGDGRLPTRTRGEIAAALNYLIESRDVVPDDTRGGYGLLDDAVVLYAAIELWLGSSEFAGRLRPLGGVPGILEFCFAPEARATLTAALQDMERGIAALSDEQIEARIGKVTGSAVRPLVGTAPPTPSVFISHSHQNREWAADLERILSRESAQTFLDQHEIRAGQDLPARLRGAIERSSAVLLLWSAAAARSDWVRREWAHALELGREVVPYRLDGTALPAELRHLVFVDSADRTHCNALLLRALFGDSFLPRAESDWFPGSWQVDGTFSSQMSLTFTLELRSNGQALGQGQVQEAIYDGLFKGVGLEGLAALARVPQPFAGTWEFDEVKRFLALRHMGPGWKPIDVRITGREGGRYRGQDDTGMYQWVLVRAERA